MSLSDTAPAPLARTPLHALHLALGAKMAGFAGYDMPINYPTGVLQEHLHTRAQAGLFDVSHMGQAWLRGRDAAARLETLVPGDLAALAPGRTRYTQFLNAEAGILDDLMATRVSGSAGGEEVLFLVVNAGCKAQDFAHIAASLPDLRLDVLPDRALIALQGPQAAGALAKVLPGHETQPFMSMTQATWNGATLYVSRSGYTGEDGYEISIPGDKGEAFAKALLALPEAARGGVGARGSRRRESGWSLPGDDTDARARPAEAQLMWSISKRRRAEGGFPGAARLQAQIAEGPARLRVGIKPEGRAPAREGVEIHAQGRKVGVVTSGGFGPSVNGPVAMGYVEAAHSRPGTRVDLIVRGKSLPAEIVALPFTPARFYRGS